jgi:hypothetical protein
MEAMRSGHDTRAMTLPLIIGGIVQFALPIVAAMGSDRGVDPQAETAEMLGRLLGSILPVALVLWFGFGRHRDPRGWWKIPLVLLPIAVLGHVAAGGALRGEREKALDSIGTAAERMLESEGRDTAALRHSGATGEAGEMERVALEWFRSVGAMRQSYERAMAEAGLETILNAETLAGDPGQRRARQGLQRARAALARARAADATLPDEFRRLVATARISEGARREALAGMEESARRDRPRLRRIRDIDGELFDSMERALDILRRAPWEPEGGDFRFARAADAAAYDSEARRLQALAREQEALIAEQSRESLRIARGLRRS